MDWEDDSAIDGLDVAEINELAQRHPGTTAFYRWQPVALLQRALESNGHELLDLVDRAEHDPRLATEVIQNVRPSNDVRFLFYAALTQRILNFTATSSALVEAMRIAIRQYDATSDLAVEYAARKAQMVRQPVVKLVNKGLRNYLLHYAQPRVGMLMREASSGSPMEFEVVLLPGELLKFDGLDADTRRYLRDQSEPLSLRMTALAYDRAVGSLYEWLHAETTRLHGPAVEQANRWIARMHGAGHGNP
jgi:hypothetical protein